MVYRFETNTVTRCIQGQPGIRLLTEVKNSEMRADPRQKVIAWQWEVELLPRAKGYTKPGRVRPALHVHRRARKERRPVRLPVPIDSRRNHGSAVVVMIVLLGLMLIFVFANVKTLHFMSRELKLIEKRQIQRLSATAAATN